MLMISLPVSSTTQVQPLSRWTLPGIGRKHVLTDSGCDRTMWRTWGATTGTVKDAAICRQIGIGSVVPKLGTNSNHFWIDSFESGPDSSCRGIEVVPKVLAFLDMERFEGIWDLSMNNSSPVGSHWKAATCFSPDSEKTVNLLSALKNKSSWLLQTETTKLPLCQTGKFLTPTISKRTCKMMDERYRKRVPLIIPMSLLSLSS